MLTVMLALASFVTSIVSGLLGMAGGVMLIALMAAVLPAPAVIPLHGMTQLFSNGSRSLLMWRDVVWREAWVFFVPLIAGVGLATYFGRGVRFEWLEPTIGVLVLLFVAWRRLLANKQVRRIPLVVYGVVGFLVGCLTLFVGATGPLIAPLFRREDWSPQQVVATMAVVQTGGHLLKLPAFLLLGFDYGPHLPLLTALLVCAFAGTYAGRRLLDSVSKERFGLLFDVVLALLGIWLLVGWGWSLRA